MSSSDSIGLSFCEGATGEAAVASENIAPGRREFNGCYGVFEGNPARRGSLLQSQLGTGPRATRPLSVCYGRNRAERAGARFLMGVTPSDGRRGSSACRRVCPSLG